MTQHTPEPWTAFRHATGTNMLGDKHLIAVFLDDPVDAHNVTRILTCVNGCANIPHPDAIPAVIAFLASITEHADPALAEVAPAVTRGATALLARLGVNSP